ncbi:LOW QUALITY PROTEIN: neuroligin-4, X-linked [Procambarus clarkii]|uniref:LOW QUALITY PROTEIN: neuroligin-4, X-linked n=1 Tax=Procambarus clarkii TaxID=6728 RepID=UPI0037422695
MWPRETVTVALCLGAVLSTLLVTTASEPHRKTPIITTKYGQLRGFYRPVTGYGIQVATYLGVPYATPPVGANRFSPTRTLSQWVGVHEATHFGPACPQRLPDISNETAALSRMSRGRLQALKRYLPALRRQSEDCLYLNLYVPVEDRPAAAYPVAVFVHGESYEWGASSLYDGSVLAALGRVIVVTINYRLGILGFFNPNVDPVGRATVANYGLMDQLAALHWVQENIVRFGGDPGHVTVMGHSTGAACLNFLVISPAAAGAGLFKRAILMSGSALSSWAAVQEPVYYAVQAARQLGCQVPDDLYRHYEALLHCLRDRTVDQILQVELETPQFLSSIGPSVDGVTIRPDWKEQHTKMGEEGRTPVDLLLGVAATDILEVFSDAEIQHGFEADHRDRLLRTFVTNNYRYHLQEIVLAITAEYTDWARPVQHPVHIRDLTAEALHDAAFVFPVTVAANQLYTPARTAFLYVLDYRPDEPDPETGPDMLLNELLYVFGNPLGSIAPVSQALNFTKTDVALSEAIITMWTNFIKSGNPNEGGVGGESASSGREAHHRYRSQEWASYDPVYRRYLDLGSRGRVRDHYRAGRVALWSWLVPGLEKVGSLYGLDSAFHKFPDYEKSDSYSGPTRPSNLSSNLLPPFTTVAPSSPATITTAKHNTQPPTVLVLANSSNVAGLMEDVLRGQQQQQQQQQGHFPYTTALSLTVAIGCSLLVLNLIVFAAVYYRRDTYRHAHSKPGGPINHESSMNETGNGVQLRNTGDNFGKPSSPSHCGTLRSSSTLRSSLATSCDGEPQHEWPPDYSSCCQSGQGSAGSGLSPGHDVANTRPPHNGTVRSVARPPPPPRSSSYPSHVEAQPLLSPTALLQISNAACSEMRA